MYNSARLIESETGVPRHPSVYGTIRQLQTSSAPWFAGFCTERGLVPHVSSPPVVVILSGRQGAGKSTIARWLVQKAGRGSVRVSEDDLQGRF